jgi:hypothetical protein
MIVCLADVCMTGPEERLIGPIKMTINNKIKFEFDYEDKEIIMKIVNIILNNPYCCREEIKKTTLNELEINLENIEKTLEKINRLEIQMEEDAIDYYRKCLFYIIIEGYPEDYFLDKELEK